MFESGSWSHGTGIKAKSDVDYMAVASGTRPALPSSALRTAKAAVEGCDWKITAVDISSPVVRITYYSGPRFEVAPCWYNLTTAEGYRVYWIAGRGDEWVLSSPQAHLDYVNEQNDRLKKKVKPLVRLLKAWKYNTGAPVSSFYLEMRAAKYAAGEQSIIYDIDLRAMLSAIVYAEVRDMNDPKAIVGRIPGCSSDANRRRTLNLMNGALSSLYTADAAKDRGDASAYWSAMYEVFGGDYPWPTW